METTDQQPAPPQGPRVSREEMKDLGRLRRSVTDRHIAGVAGGLARHLDVDVIIIRVALVVAVFFGGAGLLAYVGAWVLVPEEGTDGEPLGLDRRSRTLALAGVGVLAVLAALGDWAGAFWFPWPLAIIGALVVWFLHRKGNDVTTRSGYGYTSPTAPAAQPGDLPVDQPGQPVDPYSAYTDHYADPYAAVPPTSYARPQAPRRPRNPRKRGPILFWPTLALIALAEGVLGMVDLAVGGVAESAYAALALGVTALMLVVGAFWGRAGGLIALGLVLAIGTAAASVGDNFDAGDRSYTPVDAGDVQETYEFGGGRFTLDLSEVSDVDALDGRDISIDGVGGMVEVIVPDGMDVDVQTQVVGGQSRVFDQRSDGFDVSLDGFVDGGAEAPDMSLTIDLVGGEILVHEAA